jgi:hypothetical protein
MSRGPGDGRVYVLLVEADESHETRRSDTVWRPNQVRHVKSVGSGSARQGLAVSRVTEYRLTCLVLLGGRPAREKGRYAIPIGGSEGGDDGKDEKGRLRTAGLPSYCSTCHMSLLIPEEYAPSRACTQSEYMAAFRSSQLPFLHCRRLPPSCGSKGFLEKRSSGSRKMIFRLLPSAENLQEKR